MPLQPFATQEEVDKSVLHTLPDIFPVVPTIDLRLNHVWKEENITGWCIIMHFNSKDAFSNNYKILKIEDNL